MWVKCRICGWLWLNVAPPRMEDTLQLWYNWLLREKKYRDDASAEVGSGFLHIIMTSSLTRMFAGIFEEFTKVLGPWGGVKNKGTCDEALAIRVGGKSCRTGERGERWGTLWGDTTVNTVRVVTGFPLDLSKEPRGEVMKFFQHVGRLENWSQQVGTTILDQIPRNDTSERPVALLSDLIRWWLRLRVPEVKNWYRDIVLNGSDWWANGAHCLSDTAIDGKFWLQSSWHGPRSDHAGTWLDQDVRVC